MIITKKNNQQGMASIMFAMFLVLGISLLAIGFATLVRNDQRQALDKTLSNQAQYAAESAINKIQSGIKNGSITAANPNCDAGIIPTFTDGITVTCLTWDPSPTVIAHTALGSTPWSTPINTSGAQSLVIKWSPAPSNPRTGIYTGSVANQLSLNGSNIPSLRLVLAQNSNIAGTTGVVYIQPSSSNSNYSLTSAANSTGGIATAGCDNASPKVCTATIGFNMGSEGLLSLASLNGSSDIKSVQAFASANGSGSPLAISGAQAVITANAKSQDVSKRLVAYVSLPTSTWQPGFVASADALCKNYALGLNGPGGPNTQPGPVTGTLCPN
jgi:Tfp pilus assembly protein PilX